MGETSRLGVRTDGGQVQEDKPQPQAWAVRTCSSHGGGAQGLAPGPTNQKWSPVSWPQKEERWGGRPGRASWNQSAAQGPRRAWVVRRAGTLGHTSLRTNRESTESQQHAASHYLRCVCVFVFFLKELFIHYFTP